jgi:hypothetical protein
VKRILSSAVAEYVDGGMSLPMRFGMAILIALDRDLAEQAASIRSQNFFLQSIGGSVLNEPIPGRMRALLADATLDADPSPERRLFWHFEQFWLAAALIVAAGCIGWWAF